MLDERAGSLLTRRSLILLAGAGLASWSRAYGFGGKEFWETKDPDEWSSDDIARLLGKSPWAKATVAERTRNVRNATPETRAPRNPAGLGRPRRDPPTRSVTTYKGTVVWESASPVRAALRTKLPGGFEGQYVLGVTGLPLAKSDSNNALDRLRQVTTLTARGKQVLEPAGVQEETGNGTVYLFGFARDVLALSRDDKDVVFTTHMGRLAFTAKFNPKEMLYHGELSL
jgi:hypothetical protein